MLKESPEGLNVEGKFDIHLHGIAGFAFDDILSHSSLPFEPLETISSKLFEAGTTDYLAGLITKPWDDMLEAVRIAADYCDKVIAEESASEQQIKKAQCHGIYLEGPFISPQHKGAHDASALIDPALDRIKELLDAARGHLRMITVAPELKYGLEAVETLTKHGVVAAFGHSDADYDTTWESISLGQKHFTHLFNAMNPIHHRKPGPIIAALEAYRQGKDITVEVINDGVHLHSSIVKWAFNNFSIQDKANLSCTDELDSSNQTPSISSENQVDERPQTGVVLITDSMSATLLGDGKYRLGSLDVEVKGGKAVLAGTDTIAGSTLTLAKGVRNTADLGVDPALIDQACWRNPLRLFKSASSGKNETS
ncbi:MAG: hypothetical protein LBC50_02640 [Candidatus Ancillula sp.]|nr:hypothetical protein [Candidatus Ancillula sp.]